MKKVPIASEDGPASPATEKKKSKRMLAEHGEPMPKLPSGMKLHFADQVDANNKKPASSSSSSVRVVSLARDSSGVGTTSGGDTTSPLGSGPRKPSRSMSLQKSPQMARKGSQRSMSKPNTKTTTTTTGILSQNEEEEEEAAAIAASIAAAKSIAVIATDASQIADVGPQASRPTTAKEIPRPPSYSESPVLYQEKDTREPLKDSSQMDSLPAPESAPRKARRSSFMAMAGSIARSTSNAGASGTVGKNANSRGNSIKSHGSSLNLSSDFLGRMMSLHEKYYNMLVNSPVFLFIYACAVSVKFQIYTLTFFHTLDLIFIAILVNFIAGKTLPSIGIYNLVHAILGSLGKIGLVSGTLATQLIAKEYVASALVKKGKGVPLSYVAVPQSMFNPIEGKLLRKLYLVSMFVVEGCMWYLILLMQWIPVTTDLGNFPCIPATYPTKPTFLSNLPGFLSGDTSLSVVYNYGLPLQDGLIGGWAAWPLSAPSRQFDVEGDGIVYLYTVNCGDAKPLTPNATLNALHPGRIQLSLEQSELWTNQYVAMVSFRFPAGTHSWSDYSAYDVHQKCQVKYVLGEGHVKFTFVSDEWLMVTGGQLDLIQVEDQILHKDSVDSNGRYFNDIIRHVGSTSKHIEMTEWFTEVFTASLNGTYYDPTQAGLVSNMLQWGKENAYSGKYDLNMTWEALSGAMGSMSHYLLMQYNGSASTICRYSGVQSSGVIDIPPTVSALMLASVVLCFVTQSMQLLRCQNSGFPLMMLFHMRNSITSLIPDIKNADHSTRSIRRHMEKIAVRLGEDKKTRGEEVGTLLIAAPKEVLAMRDKRLYH
ncbi:hypothetical protein BCR33DRAFT_715293 [Rhizoclosmatium globosum]|uniref:Uncharacterized protein n=1 Tax=Rhizoclosmatium globosum TaxID=329046 RepID=A0A1Y2CIK3_9FUNG|nr:hypothetical protein BCR33DRAFT_715293 [Rhizoclosmatium globosum]|eukprot:ORY46880.1 hypothetical protein BCR33DRAFT_715293 [Rhizoclosmatium globosum]